MWSQGKTCYRDLFNFSGEGFEIFQLRFEILKIIISNCILDHFIGQAMRYICEEQILSWNEDLERYLESMKNEPC
jgi:hypothetical protein